jgi:hypothetical protein
VAFVCLIGFTGGGRPWLLKRPMKSDHKSSPGHFVPGQLKMLRFDSNWNFFIQGDMKNMHNIHFETIYYKL